MTQYQQLPDLDILWRPNTSNAAVNDRELIRIYINWPATIASLTELIQQLNSVASISPPTVTLVQGWLDEIIELEEIQAGEINDGTAHLSNLQEYEGPIPGKTITQDDRLTQAGKLQWDSALLKSKLTFSSGPRSTPQGQREERIKTLIHRIAQSCNLQIYNPSGLLIRS